MHRSGNGEGNVRFGSKADISSHLFDQLVGSREQQPGSSVVRGFSKLSIISLLLGGKRYPVIGTLPFGVVD